MNAPATATPMSGFKGRDDDVISSAGYRVGPGEIEDCILKHPAVALAAVIGVADSVRGEVPKAFVVLKTGQAAGPELATEIQALHERQAVKRASAPASASIDG